MVWKLSYGSLSVCLFYLFGFFFLFFFLICRCNSWERGTFVCVHDLLHINVAHCCILETMKPSVWLAQLVCSALITLYKANQWLITAAMYIFNFCFFPYLFHVPPSFCLPLKIIHLCKLVNLVFSLHINGTTVKYFIYSGVSQLLLLTSLDIIVYQDAFPETSCGSLLTFFTPHV